MVFSLWLLHKDKKGRAALLPETCEACPPAIFSLALFAPAKIGFCLNSFRIGKSPFILLLFLYLCFPNKFAFLVYSFL
jgi:hypothetical protein